MKLTGSCYCRALQYQVDLNSADDARTSLCHCRNCKVRSITVFLLSIMRSLHKRFQCMFVADPVKQKAFGTNYGLTAKIPKDAFQYTQGTPKEHAADNGSGTMLFREFCDYCGSFILEYGVRLT